MATNEPPYRIVPREHGYLIMWSDGSGYCGRDGYTARSAMAALPFNTFAEANDKAMKMVGEA